MKLTAGRVSPVEPCYCDHGPICRGLH